MNPHHQAFYRLQQADALPMWVVYYNTQEYPGKYMARLWQTFPVNAPTEYVMTHDSLEGLREMIPLDCSCLTRSENDAPEIVETWL